MTHTYNISGLTCTGCITKARSALLKIGDINSADIQLEPPQAIINMQKHVGLNSLQDALSKAGKFTITEADGGMHHTPALAGSEKMSWFQTYKPVLLIGIYITSLTLLWQARSGFNMTVWMQQFMGAFFLVFSFFKMLDLRGFADSYASYDIIARKWHGWAYTYAFIELALGIAFIFGFQPLLTNGLTFVVMLISIVGVLQAVMNKRKIQCACLGAVFNLPMSTITILEDALMIIMSGLMILHLL